MFGSNQDQRRFYKRSLLALAVLLGVLAVLHQRLTVPLQNRVSEISLGMTPAQVDQLLGKDILQSGNTYWGGSGAYRRYYQLDELSQFWIEVGGSYDGSLQGRVVEVGPIEPVGNWTWHGSGGLTVE
jgi:hypothetical protein